jgi:hypothetical protein
MNTGTIHRLPVVYAKADDYAPVLRLMLALEAAEIEVSTTDGIELVIRPLSKLTPELEQAVTQHRPELLKYAVRARDAGVRWLLDAVAPEASCAPPGPHRRLALLYWNRNCRRGCPGHRRSGPTSRRATTRRRPTSPLGACAVWLWPQPARARRWSSPP